MLLFFGGLILAGSFFGWLYYRERRRRIDHEEQAELMKQEKLVVVDFMHHMVEALSQGLEKEALYQRVVHAAIVGTGALSACVFEKTRDGTLRGVAVEGLFPPPCPVDDTASNRLFSRARFIEDVLRTKDFPVGEGVIGKVAASGRPVLIEDGRSDTRLLRHRDPALEVSSMICVPVLFNKETVGVLAVCNSADGKAFSKTDFSVVQSLGEQAGLAMHNAEYLALQVEKRQIDVDLNLARSIQLMLLPRRLPQIEGISIDARYRSSHSIGGDLYDVISLGDKQFGVAVADVSGKGIPASLLMAICRTNLRRFAVGQRSPAKVLAEVNRVMVREMQQGMYITMLYAVFDLEEGTVTFARAGHERPLICHADDGQGKSVAEFPDSEGMAVGLVDDGLFAGVIEERTVPFERGDVVLLYTDGVTESANAVGKEFSSSRLADTLKALRMETAEIIGDGVLDRVQRFRGRAGFDDDLTLVTIKRV